MSTCTTMQINKFPVGRFQDNYVQLFTNFLNWKIDMLLKVEALFPERFLTYCGDV
jgi:hypothetical protein